MGAMTASTRPFTASALVPTRRRRFATFAWLVLGYTLLVIMYGAWVRVTGSGAGCGDHWPTCNGEIIPRSESTKTWIEYGHRITSGILGPMSIGLVIWAWVDKAQNRVTRWCASLTLFFVVFEALIGAGLVLAELVADDASAARAAVVSLHLVNTLILTSAATFTAWFGAGNPVPRSVTIAFEGRKALVACLVGLVLVSATGAITALGDTLFPVSSVTESGLWARVNEELSLGAHFLVRLRAVHPVLAVIVGVFTASVGARFAEHGNPVIARLGQRLSILTWAQMVIGSLNIFLAAPGWLQLVHLLGAQLVWIFAILLWSALASHATAAETNGVTLSA
jgi:heme A synthase